MAKSEKNLNAVFTDTANAIRAKGVTGTMTPRDFADKIGTIPTGVTPTGSKYMDENGSYDVTNYAHASVHVTAYWDNYFTPGVMFLLNQSHTMESSGAVNAVKKARTLVGDDYHLTVLLTPSYGNIDFDPQDLGEGYGGSGLHEICFGQMSNGHTTLSDSTLLEYIFKQKTNTSEYKQWFKNDSGYYSSEDEVTLYLPVAVQNFNSFIEDSYEVVQGIFGTNIYDSEGAIIPQVTIYCNDVTVTGADLPEGPRKS